jgi:hypothetical protein
MDSDLSALNEMWRRPLSALKPSFTWSDAPYRDLKIEELDWYSSHHREDLLVFTCGYEQRSIYFADHFAKSFQEVWFSPLRGRRDLYFNENLAWCTEQSFRLVDLSGDRPGWQSAHSLMEGIIGLRNRIGNRRLSVTVDISCASRERLCSIVSGLLRVSAMIPLTVTFAYVPMAFESPLDELPPIEVFAPVSPDFLSLEKAPGSGISLVLGLGYEQDRALGAVEYLEPDEVWCFKPGETDERFDEALASTNQILLDRVGPNHVLEYSLREPGQLLSSLTSLIRPNGSGRRTVIVPFGPKLFTLSSALVAAMFPGEVSVYRVSANRNEPVTNRVSSGAVVGIRCEMPPNPTAQSVHK